MKPSDLATEIRIRVTMPDAIEMYAPNPAPRMNRIPCPIHGGSNPNLSFTDDLYHCFVCGDGGDVIHFVMHIFGIQFSAAVDKLNTDFSLNLPVGRKATISEQREIARRRREVDREREEASERRRALEEHYWSLWGKWIEYDKALRTLAPSSPDYKYDPLWVEAVTNIDYIAHRIDTEL